MTGKIAINSLLALLALLVAPFPILCDNDEEYMKREHSLVRPFQGGLIPILYL